MTAATVALVVGLTALAWQNRFVQDDAFISFRYARSLASGHGLVWNPGERVEGYTNFAWTLLAVFPHKCGFDPVGFTYVLGVLLFGASLVLTYRLSAGLAGPAAGLVAAGLLGSNYTFSSFATGGMETQLQACLFVLAAYVLVRLARAGGYRPGSVALFSTVLALALLTRPDSLVMVMLLGVPAAVGAWRVGSERTDRAVRMLCLLAPVGVALVGHETFRVLYYRDLVPNTFYARLPVAKSPLLGGYYFAVFLASYLLLPLLPVLPRAVRLLWRSGVPGVRPMVALITAWFAYLLLLGGDFMEFRMLVPVMPLMFVLMVVWLFREVRGVAARAGVVLLVLAGSVFHALCYPSWHRLKGPESVPELARHLSAPNENWAGIGKVLAESFGRQSRVVISVTAAGAIPYYSGLSTVDMFGLNDRWIARHGAFSGSRPGHVRGATLGYLVSRGVNIVIGHPLMLAPGRGVDSLVVDRLTPAPGPDGRLPDSASVIEIPVHLGWRLAALYLVRSPEVEVAIRTFGWRHHPLKAEMQ